MVFFVPPQNGSTGPTGPGGSTGAAGPTGPTGGGGGGGGDAVVAALTNLNAGAMTRGQAAYLTTTTNSVDLADATANNALANVTAFVQDASIASAASGNYVLSGVSFVRLVGGLGALTSGTQLYLSTTAGSCTTVEPAGSGNVSQPVGEISDPLTYDGAADLLVEAIISYGNKAIIP